MPDLKFYEFTDDSNQTCYIGMDGNKPVYTLRRNGSKWQAYDVEGNKHWVPDQYRNDLMEVLWIMYN